MIVIWGIILLAALVGVGVLAIAVSRRQRADADAAEAKMDEVMLNLLQGQGARSEKTDA